MMKKFLVVACVIFALIAGRNYKACAQTQTPPPTTPQSLLSPRNGVYTPEHLPNRKPVPYVYLREADVMWQKRIWRKIDLREKINHSLYYPVVELGIRPALFHVIQKGIINQQFDAYDPIPAALDPDEEFKVAFTYTEAQKRLVREVTILKQDTVTGDMIPVTVPDTITSQDVAQYWIKEDWFFDKQRSVLDVRILGIAPVIEKKDENGQFRGYEALFWLYYEACRPWFAKFQCFNPYNDSEWRTYDEIFHKRLFNSYISMENNVYNRPVVAYTQGDGMYSLLESERIKDEIFKFEHDMWHF
jgi:gliding motility associated protien GldN